MPYTTSSNVTSSTVYTFGVDYGTGDSSVGYLSNGSVSNVTITIDEIVRAARSLPPICRQGTDLKIPVLNHPPARFYTTGESPSLADSQVQYTTVSVPWETVRQAEAAQQYREQQATLGYGLGSLAGTQTMSGIAAMQAQYYNQMNQINLSYQGWLGMGSYSYIAPYETPEERAAREERHVKAMAKRKAAESRAEQLLFTILKPEQVRQYREDGYFETEVDDRVYRIKKGRAQNIEQIVNGKPVLRLCAHPRDMVPDADNMLAQFLMLKTDEQQFLKTANHTRIYQ